MGKCGSKDTPKKKNVFIWTPKIMRKKSTAVTWICYSWANHLALIACFISWEKWVQS